MPKKTEAVTKIDTSSLEESVKKLAAWEAGPHGSQFELCLLACLRNAIGKIIELAKIVEAG